MLDASGTPKFVNSKAIDPIASRLEVPLDDFVSSLADDMPADVTQLLVDSSPRIDTVRRWVAPFTGTIRTTGPVALVDPDHYDGDGAQVSIEHHGAKVWSTVLDEGATSANPDTSFHVDAGDQVWFRVHVIKSAVGDHVTWDPTVTYVDAGASSWSTDAQGRSQSEYHASEDFTTFGRTGARTSLTDPGQTKVSVTLTPGEALSDDVQVVLVNGRGRGAGTTSHADDVAAAHHDVGDRVQDADCRRTVDQSGGQPNDTSDDFEESDWVEVHVISDSPVDPTRLGVEIALADLDPTAPEVQLNSTDQSVVEDLGVPLDIPVVPDVRVFGRSTLASAYVPWTAPKTGTAKLHVVLGGAGLTPSFSTEEGEEARSSDMAITVKRPTVGRVAKKTFVATEKDTSSCPSGGSTRTRP